MTGVWLFDQLIRPISHCISRCIRFINRSIHWRWDSITYRGRDSFRSSSSAASLTLLFSYVPFFGLVWVNLRIQVVCRWLSADSQSKVSVDESFLLRYTWESSFNERRSVKISLFTSSSRFTWASLIALHLAICFLRTLTLYRFLFCFESSTSS